MGGGTLLVIASIALFFFRRRRTAEEVRPELGHTEIHGEDEKIQKAELPGVAEEHNVPLDTKGTHVIMSPELEAAERLPEMP